MRSPLKRLVLALAALLAGTDDKDTTRWSQFGSIHGVYYAVLPIPSTCFDLHSASVMLQIQITVLDEMCRPTSTNQLQLVYDRQAGRQTGYYSKRAISDDVYEVLEMTHMEPADMCLAPRFAT